MATEVSEPARLFDEERQWCDRRNRAVTAAAEADGTAGAALLDGGEAAMQKQVTTLTRLRVESDACDAAIAEARRRRVVAVQDIWLAEAADLRLEAERLEEEAKGREQKTARLLAALEEWEDCQYVPKPPPEPGMSGGLVGGSPMIVHIRIPHTQGLRHEADRLKSEAAVLEARSVVTAGSISTNDRDEVLLSMGGWDPMKVAPTLIAVEKWLAEKEPAALERLERGWMPKDGEGKPLEHPLSYTLVWQDGEIDVQRSRITPVEA